MNIQLLHGDCLQKLKELPDNSVDSIVTDPPYGIGFMNKEWDSPEKLKQQQERDLERTKIRNQNGTAPVTAKFSPFPGQGFKGRKEGLWFQQWCEEWGKECLRVLKPGGHLISFSAPRMYHRMTSGLEDAGFEIRDQIMWLFGSGFPKSHNIGKAIDKLQGNIREVIGKKIQRVDGTTRNKQPNGGFMKENVVTKESDGYVDVTKPGSSDSEKWEGWGTALKPAHEPIVMARKPLSEKSVAENVLKWGTGGLNIDETRIKYVGYGPYTKVINQGNDLTGWGKNLDEYRTEDWEPNNTGRWPANFILDEEAAELLDEQSGISGTGKKKIGKDRRGFFHEQNQIFSGGTKTSQRIEDYGDKGGASRFFYVPKASKKDRDEGLNDFPDYKKYEDTSSDNHSFSHINNKDMVVKNVHPTVKPTQLMLYLIKLVTPKGGVVLDPFMGSGSTGKAAVRGDYSFIGIEKEEEYIKLSQARIEYEQHKSN